MGTRALRVLVAEDDHDLLQNVAKALEALGANVTLADSGAELMHHLAADDPFDLIVTDVSMPWMTGLQAMHSGRYAGLETPVIVMTGLRDESIPAQVESLGAKAWLLRKPFGVSELHRAIAGLIPHVSRQRAAR